MMTEYVMGRCSWLMARNAVADHEADVNIEATQGDRADGGQAPGGPHVEPLDRRRAWPHDPEIGRIQADDHVGWKGIASRRCEHGDHRTHGERDKEGAETFRLGIE